VLPLRLGVTFHPQQASVLQFIGQPLTVASPAGQQKSAGGAKAEAGNAGPRTQFRLIVGMPGNRTTAIAQELARVVVNQT
jgi:hypothetical protein